MSDKRLIDRWAAEAVVAANEAGGMDVEDSALVVVASRQCRHMAVHLIEASRIVKCQGCGMKLDPFWVLLGYAHHERMFRNSMEVAKNDRDRLREQVEALKKERANLGAQVRRKKAT